MITDIRCSNIIRLNLIHNGVMGLSAQLNYRIFPIYIRYLKGENMFALLYFTNKEYFELGFASNKNALNQFDDASWMKYPGIKYGIKIFEKDNLYDLFKKIKSNI